MWKFVHFVIVYLIVNKDAFGDIYMHNPRGSNNRLNEQSREVNNENRLFDSQNNNRGGYNVGNLYYYSGSSLQIEWTNQHSCSDPNANCEIIIQYMCGEKVRDGVTTTTVPVVQTQCQNGDCNTDKTYGLHETYEHYLSCMTREANGGLYPGDWNRAGRVFASTRTRQNQAGTRRGYECPEERDYYPYWAPTPWIDIAVLTNRAAQRCPYYKAQSENVVGRWYCDLPRSVLVVLTSSQRTVPITKAACEAFVYSPSSTSPSPAVITGRWVQAPSHNRNPPECRESDQTRDNHLGNVRGTGESPNYNWTLPEVSSGTGESCILRIRYNVSTTDYADPNGDGSDVVDNVWKLAGLANAEEGRQRGFQLVNNPNVQVFPGLTRFKLALAANLAQFGRTFQDRSHVFEVRPRSSSLQSTGTPTIRNINVRGKRGNIVQVYPSVEYDFVPNTLRITPGDYAHFQWTGSNSNNNNNDGQGRAGTDRSNVVLQAGRVYPKGLFSSVPRPDGLTQFGAWGRNYPTWNITGEPLLGWSRDDLDKLAFLSSGQLGGSMEQLNDAGTYFDLGPRRATMNGVYHYMCTRNNNFSNRDQKARIICSDERVEYGSLGSQGGSLETSDGAAGVEVAPGQLTGLIYLCVESWPENLGEKRLASDGRSAPSGVGYASGFGYISVPDPLPVSGSSTPLRIRLRLTRPYGFGLTVYRTQLADGLTAGSNVGRSWETVPRADFTSSAAMVTFDVDRGGLYVVRYHDNSGVIAGAVVAVMIVLALLVCGCVVYLRRNPAFSARLKRTVMC